MSKSIQWILQSKLVVNHVSHIIDDFIFDGRRNSSECANYLQKYFDLCKDIGIPIKPKKTINPTTCAPIYGIDLDTNKMEARLPQDKLSEVRGLLRDNMQRKNDQI